MTGFNPRWIVGKTVASAENRPFPAGDNGRGGVAHNPIIRFTDGSSITFCTEETEVGEYGVEIVYRRPDAGAGA